MAHMDLHKLLDQLRIQSQSEFEKGEYFERLVKVYLESDDFQGQYYNKVWHYSDWAKKSGRPTKDIGIDLVASLADGSGLCAIQCKFYSENHHIRKSDIDSFVSAAATVDFTSVVLVDTTLKDLSPNARQVLDNLDRDYHRITIADLEKSRINWGIYIRKNKVEITPPKDPKGYQKEAIKAVRSGLSKKKRGKLIMACGTGKTFTGLKIAEDIAGKGRLVLFMVPSLALMSQSVREWKSDCAEDFLAFSVCSDSKIGKPRPGSDAINLTVHDLAFPATTDSTKIADQVRNALKADREKMIVVFSTYQSIQTISDAQKTHGMKKFDLIICDEAHRTTGATLVGEEESHFVRIHDNKHVKGKKRLYMTATPKVFGENVKRKARIHTVELASMDDSKRFGETLFYRGFSWAVENGHLSDYKVVVLAVDEGFVSSSIQDRLAESDKLTLDDATKIVGCYKALSRQKLIGETRQDLPPMKRALAFCRSIAASKMLAEEFTEAVDGFVAAERKGNDTEPMMPVEARHVDGTFNSKEREERLDWLKAETNDDTCRILTNARCLSEGVDVPALDAIMFMHPRNSQIDVIQSVGRVMRTASNKDMGYVILPVVIPAGVTPEETLNDNERYRVVWQVLNALRTHDDRFDAMINQADLGEDISNRLEIIGINSAETAVVDAIDFNRGGPKLDIGESADRADYDVIDGDGTEPPQQISMVFEDLSRAIRAKIVEKCGTREYWDTWARDIAKIAQTHITRITTITEVQQFPITFKLSGPAPNLGVRHGSVVAGARWGHSNTIQAAAWLVKLR